MELLSESLLLLDPLSVLSANTSMCSPLPLKTPHSFLPWRLLGQLNSSQPAECFDSVLGVLLRFLSMCLTVHFLKMNSSLENVSESQPKQSPDLIRTIQEGNRLLYSLFVIPSELSV